jgi:hypothetical protein
MCIGTKETMNGNMTRDIEYEDHISERNSTDRYDIEQGFLGGVKQ